LDLVPLKKTPNACGPSSHPVGAGPGVKLTPLPVWWNPKLTSGPWFCSVFVRTATRLVTRHPCYCAD